MSKLDIIDTAKRSFDLLKKDPTLIVLFILPALFPINSIMGNSLMVFIVLGIPPDIPSTVPVPFFILCLIVFFLVGVWASAGAILKVMELEKGSRLGLKEALSRGLKKVPNLLVPVVVGLAIYLIMVTSLTIAISNYPFIRMAPLVQDVGPDNIVPRLAVGLLFIIGLYILIRLYLCQPACVLENNFGLKTSWKLVKGNWWKLFAIFLIFAAMSAIINQVPVIGNFLSDLIVSPLSIAVTTLIYFQLRKAGLPEEEHRESP
jgi:hypothetical protein